MIELVTLVGNKQIKNNKVTNLGWKSKFKKTELLTLVGKTEKNYFACDIYAYMLFLV